MTPKYDILCSFIPLVKHYHVTYVYGYDIQFKIIYRNCNGYVKCSDISRELLYIKLLRAVSTSIGI